MGYGKFLRAGLVAGALALTVAPAHSQSDNSAAEDVRAEIAEAMDAIGEYSQEQREEAETQAREALEQLDAEIAKYEESVRENWEAMSESAKESARERLKELRSARNELGERFGALQAETDSTWDELKAAFADAWDDVSDAWDSALESLQSE